MSRIRNRDIEKELTFKSSRSSGAGGQHVNKVNTKVELSFSIKNSQALSEQEKELLLKKLKNKLTKEGILKITSQKTRSQADNKKNCIEKLFETLEKALKVRKKRKKTKIPIAIQLKRLKNKRLKSEKKQNRRKNYL